ncbi:class I SAM-dependent methyltransferase [Streptomyces sp. NPDC127098]|uniref:class I SAM-dependent methyltransferase n=1 Tax=Streptomyces sp. NPDC127098 TaxID=3347137 RepID=UPI003663437A
MTDRPTNDTSIRRWNTVPREAMEAMEPEGDFAKRHLLNPVLLRMVGDVRGRRVLDAGCGHGYLSRMLADRHARVVGVEPTDAMFGYAVEKERALRQGVEYVQADLGRLPDLGDPFDAVVCSMVLPAIPDWKPAMRACVRALRTGGLFVFSVNHPAFEQLLATWRAHGAYRSASSPSRGSTPPSQARHGPPRPASRATSTSPTSWSSRPSGSEPAGVLQASSTASNSA